MSHSSESEYLLQPILARVLNCGFTGSTLHDFVNVLQHLCVWVIVKCIESLVHIV